MPGLGSYMPDLADTNPGICTKAENVVILRGKEGLEHGPQKGLTVLATATALPDVCRGGKSFVNSAGTYSVFVGTTSNLYKMSGAFALDASVSVGSGYSVPSGTFWGFASFRQYAHAINLTDGLLKFDLDSDSAFSAVSGGPTGEYLFTAFNALFVLGADGDNRLLRHSAIGNSLVWNELGAGFRTMPDGEELMAGAELTPDFAIVLQRNAIRGLYRQPSGQLFEVRKLATGVGCVNPRAFAHTNGLAFWCDNDGVYMMTADGAIRNISKDRISTTLLASLASDGFTDLEFGIDRVGNRLIIRYRAQGISADDTFEDLLTYDWALDEWATLKVNTTALFEMATPAVSLDEIDPDVYGTLDELEISLDSRFWAGGEPKIAVLDADRKFAFFDGANLAATTETSQAVHGASVLVTRVTPLVDTTASTLRILTRDRLADAVMVGDAVAMQSDGTYPVRGRGKYTSYRHEVPAGTTWSYFRGVDEGASKGRKGGRR